MKKILALILFLFASPAIAAPAATGTFHDPNTEAKEGIFVTTSTSTKRTFAFFTSLWDCDVETLDECSSQQLWIVADLRSVTLGESIGVASTVIDGDTVTVGTYFLNETGTGYTLFLVHSGSSPFKPETPIYDQLYDFSECIVSPDPEC